MSKNLPLVPKTIKFDAQLLKDAERLNVSVAEIAREALERVLTKRRCKCCGQTLKTK